MALSCQWGDFSAYAGASEPTFAFIQLVLTDLGRMMGVPRARLMMSCADMPSALETPNKTV